MFVILCTLFCTFLKCYSKKGSIGFHRLPTVSTVWERFKILGRPSNARRCKVNASQGARGRYQAALVSPDPLLLPIPEASLQHHNLRVFFELISEERSRGNQCQAPAGGAAASLGAAFRRPDTHGAQTASFHTSNQHPALARCTPCHRPWQPWQPLHTPGTNQAVGNPGWFTILCPCKSVYCLLYRCLDAAPAPLRNMTQTSTRGR